MISTFSDFREKRLPKMSFLSIYAFLQILLMLIIIVASSRADANRHQTNKNDISNLFQSEIEDRQGLDKFLENSKNQAESGIGNKAGLQELGTNEGALENKTSELNSINANSLESRGQEERAKEENAYYEVLEIDYTDPKILNHKKDIDKITDANEKLTSRLIDGLRDLDIDCKTVKGDKELEPQYAIEIKKEHFKDTKYNKTTCEELRNKYNCTDTLKLSCKKRGMKWNPWQYREVQIAGDTVYHGAKHLGYAVFWKKKRWGWHLTFDSAGWRVFLSNHFGIPLEQIHEQIHFPGGARGIGGNHPIYEHWRIVFDAYLFGYNYRDGHEICEEWVEDWTENCRLQ
jgi:hypothetical protein